MINILDSLQYNLKKLKLFKESQQVRNLIKIADSRRRITQLLHFSPRTANYLHKTYGKNAFLIGRWTHDKIFGPGIIDKSIEEKLTSFQNRLTGNLKRHNELIDEVEKLYHLPYEKRASFWENSQIAKKFGLTWWVQEDKRKDSFFRSPLEDYNLENFLSELEAEIDNFFSTINYLDIIRAAKDGKVNLNEYKHLNIQEAEEKYHEKLIANELPTILNINGWRWVNAGPRCNWVGKEMRNCGGTGVMAGSEERTMLVLLDDKNKPHAILTWSPDTGLITGVEGRASKELKDEYLPYVRELVRHLKSETETLPVGAKAKKFRPPMLNDTIKPILRLYLDDQIEIIKKFSDSAHTDFFHVREPDGVEYLYDSYTLPEYENRKVKWRPEFENLSISEIKDILKSEGRLEYGRIA